MFHLDRFLSRPRARGLAHPQTDAFAQVRRLTLTQEYPLR
jgi:hypothetical protein